MDGFKSMDGGRHFAALWRLWQNLPRERAVEHTRHVQYGKRPLDSSAASQIAVMRTEPPAKAFDARRRMWYNDARDMSPGEIGVVEKQRWEEPGDLRVTIEWDGAHYRALCREYDLVATGKTLSEAREALVVMIRHFLSLTDVRAWNAYFASIQEDLDEDVNTSWASDGDHVAN